MRLKETSKMQTAFTKNLDINNLQSNMLKQHWATILSLIGQHISMLVVNLWQKKEATIGPQVVTWFE